VSTESSAAIPMTQHPVRRWKGRLVRYFSLFAVVPIGVAFLILSAVQGRLIYPGPRYDPARKIPTNYVLLRYETDQGKQVSFYQPPRAGGRPKRLWLLCNGNGGAALGWRDMLASAADPEAGFLLFDYPGYGFCEGSCTPQRILRATEAAVDALGAHLKLPRDELDRRLGVLGHSLGAAAVLQYAARHPVRRIVLAAPFTTMVQEVNHLTGTPIGWLVGHRFDNEARLNEVAARDPRPPVDILHGDRDEMIPQAMGRRLAEAHPGWVRFVSVPRADHNRVVDDAMEQELSASKP
jgi:uncharacterized protein